MCYPRYKSNAESGAQVLLYQQVALQSTKLTLWHFDGVKAKHYLDN